MIVEGQIHGGVAQGIANALLEEIVYDETGEILTTSLADYLPPTVREIPPIEMHHLETRDRRIASRARRVSARAAPSARRRAVLGAINDALRPFGVEINEMPATPRRIHAALREGTEPGQMTREDGPSALDGQRRGTRHPRSSRAGRWPTRSARIAG